MLYRRRRVVKRRPRKRVVRRVSKRYIRRSVIPRSVGPPKQLFAKLRWSHTYSANIAASGYATREFRLNSLYDPDYTGAGDQPYYFDQYASFYGRYRVYGAKINLIGTCSSSTADLFHPTLLVNMYADLTPGWSVLPSESAKRSIRCRLIPGQTNKTISRYYDLKSILGVSRSEYNTSEPFQALCTASPSRPVILAIALLNNSASSSITWGFDLQITFYCKFFDNNLPAGS